MVKKKEEKKGDKSIEQIQYEKGNCFKCDLWNAWEGCCDRAEGADCSFEEDVKE